MTHFPAAGICTVEMVAEYIWGSDEINGTLIILDTRFRLISTQNKQF